MIREWLGARKTFLLPAALVSAGILLARGADWLGFGAASCLLAAGALGGSGAWPAIPAAFLAVSGAALGHGSQPAALLMVSGLVSSVSGRTFPDRSLGLLGALLAAQAGDLAGTIPILSGAVPAAFFDRPRHRAVLAAVLIPAAVILGGFPVAFALPETTVQEAFTGHGESWPGIVNLDQSSPAALMRVEGGCQGGVTLILEAGGVRDSLPVGFVATENVFIPVLPGRDSLVIESPGPFVEIRLTRPPVPFQHPVIHLGPSHSSPEEP